MMRRSIRLLIALASFAAAFAVSAAAAPEEEPRVVTVAPVRSGEELLCRVVTAGLPEARAEESMRGGLPSALDLLIELIDEEERVLVRRSIRFRISFDLWEEFFRVGEERDASAGERERRFDDIDALRRFLRELNGLPVAPFAALRGEGRYRIRVALVTHAIAPAEKERFGDWIAGGETGTEGDADRREVSLGFGALIRYFFGGGGEEAAGASASDWFLPEEVDDAQD